MKNEAKKIGLEKNRKTRTSKRNVEENAHICLG